MLRVSDLDYDLPEGRIAISPAVPRDSARLMLVRRSATSPEHLVIRDLPDILEPSDLLIRNRSRVIPARFLGRRRDSQGKVECLYLRDAGPPGEWICMCKSRRFKTGTPIDLLEGETSEPTGYSIELVERAGDDEPGAWRIRATDPQGAPAHALPTLEHLGLPPLPPYIRAARRANGTADTNKDDNARYQTVYAKEAGSVAAPTAGLHFTPELLEQIGSRGATFADVVLHVGSGTFRTVETEFVEQHDMHTERCSIPRHTRVSILEARRNDARVIAVGTTAARTLEAHATISEPADWLDTDILITPGYTWRWTDALLTNFHLPRSTLMAMVAALLPEGVPQLLDLYKQAIEMNYRFYSYGDAMLILP